MQTETFIFIAKSGDAGRRLDQVITEYTDALTRSAVQKLCGEGHICVNGKIAGKNHRVQGGEEIAVTLPPVKALEAMPEDIPLEIFYEDQHLLVVNKPKGMVVHPAAGNEEGTMVNALLHHCAGSLSGIGGIARPGIVHRIDKDTSGLLVVAKTDIAHTRLAEAVKAHSFARIYQAVVYGNVKEDSGSVNAPIGRHPADRKKMCVTTKNAREAVTHYRVLKRYEGYTELELRLETGRTHQIRVHMRHIGHPVAGDPVYGPKKVITALRGQCLHARTLGFSHPVTGAYLEFTSELPETYTQFLSKLKPLGE